MSSPSAPSSSPGPAGRTSTTRPSVVLVGPAVSASAGRGPARAATARGRAAMRPRRASRRPAHGHDDARRRRQLVAAEEDERHAEDAEREHRDALVAGGPPPRQQHHEGAEEPGQRGDHLGRRHDREHDGCREQPHRRRLEPGAALVGGRRPPARPRAPRWAGRTRPSRRRSRPARPGRRARAPPPCRRPREPVRAPARRSSASARRVARWSSGSTEASVSSRASHAFTAGWSSRFMPCAVLPCAPP